MYTCGVKNHVLNFTVSCRLKQTPVFAVQNVDCFPVKLLVSKYVILYSLVAVYEHITSSIQNFCLITTSKRI